MSRFRAINQPSQSPAINYPSQSPPRHSSGERQLSDVVSRQNGETDKSQAPSPTQAALATSKANTAKTHEFPEVVIPVKKIRLSPQVHSGEQKQSSTARSWAALVPQDNQSSDQFDGKGDISEAVAKAKKAVETPRKKKKNSRSSTSKGRRMQAPREKKVVLSIEHSVRKRRASSTPDNSVDGASESEYTPSLAIMTPRSAANTPPPRSPQKHPSICPDAGYSGLTQPSLQTNDTPVVIEREPTTAPTISPNLEATSTPSLASPSVWSSPLRAKKYEEWEFVELPEEIFEYEKTEKEMLEYEKTEKKMRQQLEVKREAVIAGKRKEKGKVPERKDKIKAEKVEQKAHKSRTSGLEDHLIADGSEIASEDPQASNEASAQRLPKGKTQEKQAHRYKPVMIKAEDRSDIVDVRSHAGFQAKNDSSEGFQDGNVQRDLELQMPEEQTMRLCGHKRPLNEDGRKPFERRDTSAPEASRRCSCALLPEYFTSNPNRAPRLGQWHGGKLEFFEHAKQISCCRGSIHPPHVIDACRRVLRQHGYPDRGDEESLESMFESDNEFLSTNDRDDGQLRRAQSSIPPPIFYGYADSYRPGPSAESSSRSAPTTNKKPGSVEEPLTLKKLPTEITPQKILVVREKIKPITKTFGPSPNQHSSSVVVGDSPPLGKPRRADVPCHQTMSDAPGGEASSKRSSSFSARRTRHQSAPVDLYRRANAVDDSDSSLQPEQIRRKNPLQEISNNLPSTAIQGLHRKIDSLLERLPATLTTSSNSLVQPLSAQTAATDIGGGSGAAEQSNVRKRKRLSAAEQKLRHPELSSDVVDSLRKSDEQIIEIGRIVSPYERHRSAPEAFAYRGHLRAEYNGLLEKVENGVLVWTAKEIRRLTR